MRQQWFRSALPRGPGAKPPLGETLLSQPESLAIIDQDFDGRPAPVAEDENAAGERVRPTLPQEGRYRLF